MSRFFKTLLCLIAWQLSVMAYGQSNILSNGGFEGHFPSGYYPVYGQEFSLRRAPAWYEFTGDGDIRWFFDSLWIPQNQNQIDPSIQNGHFNNSYFNSAMPWDPGVPTDTMFHLSARQGHYFVGFDAKSDGFDREGVQAHIDPCGLNSGIYQLSLSYSKVYGNPVSPHFFLSISNTMNTRRHILDEVTVPWTATTPGQWYTYNSAFTLDVNNPDQMNNDWFAITGQQLGNSNPAHYLYFDDVRLYRPCDDILRCNPTHGQICPTIATMLPPNDLLTVRDIDNVEDIRLVISNTLQQSLLDTTWHNPNGFTEFRLARTNLPAQMATGNYDYTLTLSNDCGAMKHGATLQVMDTALYNLTPPWTDSTAHWSPMPIPCCLDSLTLSNVTIRGDVSYIVRDQITVQSGVSIAPNSHVTLQAGNVIEIAQAEFDGSNSTLEILEIPCPQRQAQGQTCSGGHATIDGGGYTASAFTVDSAKAAVNAQGTTTIQQTPSPTPSPKPHPIAIGSPKITISPNPANDRAEILLQLPAATTATLTLLDLQNRPLRQILTNQSLPAGLHRQTVQLQDLPPGIYLLQLRTPETITHTRLVKQ